MDIESICYHDKAGEGEIISKACVKASVLGPSLSLVQWDRGSVCSKTG